MRQCTKCGYFSENSDDIRCPICKGLMTEPDNSPCNPDTEEDLNGGYHDDFQEDKKTGEYCDKGLEKYTNGGMHFHENNKVNNPVGKSPAGYNVLAIMLFIFSLCSPVFGILFAVITRICMRKGTSTITEEGYKKIKIAVVSGVVAVILIQLITYAVAFLKLPDTFNADILMSGVQHMKNGG